MIKALVKGRFFAREETFIEEKIESLTLVKKAGADGTEYSICIERDASGKENFYLWNYIQRDIVCRVLEGFVTYVYSPVEEHAELLRKLCGTDYSNKTFEDGTSLFWYAKPDFYLITSIIADYWEMWECAAPLGTPYYVSFGGYEKELGKDELECVVKEDKLQGYLVKVVPLGDNDGFWFAIDESRFSEKELISRIRSVLEQYHLTLKVDWDCE